MKALQGRGYWAALIALWAVAALIYWQTHLPAIATHGFPDADDAMRLQEVRDWLAGQSWFDVGQHRMNAPWGTSMHWSRLVDLPIAATVLLLRPFVGDGAAETGALVIVPLLTMLCVMLALGAAARRLLAPPRALLAAGLVPLTVGAIQQLQPLRIDHHGWQMALAAAMLAGLLDPRSRRGGSILGVAGAAWLAISLEGLPLAAATGAWLAARWLATPQDNGRARLTSFAVALGGTTSLAVLATRGITFANSCDALSPVHGAVLLVVAAGVSVTARAAGSRAARLGGLTATALLALALYRWAAPQCAAGAFAGMDPLVRAYWYDNVVEGLPVWRQSWPVAVTGLAFPALGLLGTGLGWRMAAAGERAAWLDTLALLTAAIAVALLVQRAAAVAAILALPGSVVLLLRAVAAAQRLRIGALRVPLSAGAALALLPTAPGLVAGSLASPADAPRPSSCATTADYRAARTLGAGAILSNIDIGPGLLVETGHAVVASGHHRNQRGLHDAILAFVGSEAEAHAIVRRRRVAWIVVCADMREMGIYASRAPHGFWSQLRDGRTPGWLASVRLNGSRLSVWRVIG